MTAPVRRLAGDSARRADRACPRRPRGAMLAMHPTMNRTLASLGLASLSLATCLMLPGHASGAIDPPGMVIGNGLTARDLTANLLTVNRGNLRTLITKPLSTESFSAKGPLHATLLDPSAREVMRKLVTCALPPGKDTSVKWTPTPAETNLATGGAAKSKLATNEETFEGELGLCPEWATWSRTEPVPQACRELVSACVLARVNATGAKVAILMEKSREARWFNAAANDAAAKHPDLATYTVPEGAFYGNILDPDGLNPDMEVFIETDKLQQGVKIRRSPPAVNGAPSARYTYKNAYYCYASDRERTFHLPGYQEKRLCALVEGGPPEGVCVARLAGACDGKALPLDPTGRGPVCTATPDAKRAFCSGYDDSGRVTGVWRPLSTMLTNEAAMVGPEALKQLDEYKKRSTTKPPPASVPSSAPPPGGQPHPKP